MTKAGASGAKSRARRTQQATGAKYTKLRKSGEVGTRYGRVIQFLTESYEVKSLPYQLAAAWARQGLRVLMLHEYEPYQTDMRLYSRRVKERKAAEARAQAHPGPRSTILLPHDAGKGHGELVEQLTPWYERDPSNRLGNDTLLREALETGRTHFDIVVLMGRGHFPRPHLVDDFVVLAHTEGIPASEELPRGNGLDTRTERMPLSPEQSAALLRDRHLRFLYHPVALLGMITVETPWSGDQASPDREFVKAVMANMAAVGLPLLGHVTQPRNGDLKAQAERDRNPSTVVTTPLDQGVLAAAQAIHSRR
ncbi:hypothetical protein [Streptomyces sp. NPDC093225]|uniref:hypothetical protein n=1 Tax=Streptomyces sp. NPDC093225 TaxID=3366034 RepID=UPI00382E5DA1